jgi:predicted enzyme related to lactoylglutathione lyase
MWWGPTFEAADPRELARFYAALLDWEIVEYQPDVAVVAVPRAASFLVFQHADGYRRPVWPPVDGEQRPMVHLDFQVADLDAAVAEAEALGATTAGHQPQANVRVMIDPAGHPFCLCLDADG